MRDAHADVAQAVAFFRNPSRFSGASFFAPPLTERAGLLIRLASGGQPLLDQYAQRCAVRSEELRDAALFFVQQLMISPQATYYQLLGVDNDVGTQTIKIHHRCLMRLFHPDKKLLSQSEWSEDFAEKANKAYAVLGRPDTRRRYDETLQALANNPYVRRFNQWEPVSCDTPFAAAESHRSRHANRLRRILPYFVWSLAGFAALALICASLISALRE